MPMENEVEWNIPATTIHQKDEDLEGITIIREAFMISTEWHPESILFKPSEDQNSLIVLGDIAASIVPLKSQGLHC